MKINGNSVERVVPVVGFLFLLISAVASFFISGDKASLLEKFGDSQIIVRTVHVICTSFCAFLIIRPRPTGIVIIMMIESILTILTNYAQLGIFFYYGCVCLILCKELYPRFKKPILFSSFIIHLISLGLTYTHGIPKMCINFFSSIFYLIFFLWIYSLLKARLSCHLLKNVIQNEKLGDKKKGEELKLSSYNLSERQIQLVLDNIYNNLSFKELSEKYYVSISTVKSEFVGVYKIFGVSKLEELRLLLLQFQVTK